MSETKDALKEAREAWQNREKEEKEQEERYISKLEALISTNNQLETKSQILEWQVEEALDDLEECKIKRRDLEDQNGILLKQISTLLDEKANQPKPTPTNECKSSSLLYLLCAALFVGLIFMFVDTSNYIEDHHQLHNTQYDETKILTAQCLSLNRKTVNLLEKQNKVLNECNQFKRGKR